MPDIESIETLSAYSVSVWSADEFRHEIAFRAHHGIQIPNHWYTLKIMSHYLTNVPLLRVHQWPLMIFKLRKIAFIDLPEMPVGYT